MVGSIMHIWGDPKSDSMFSAWKWFTVLYEICFSIEVVITVGFWAALWKPMKDLPQYEPPLQLLGLILDHSLPLFCLTIDFIFG